MTKNFCDVCGSEMTEKNKPKGGTAFRMGTTVTGIDGKKVMVEVTTGIDDCWNKGEICKHCIIDAIQTLDDRPKAVPAPNHPAWPV